MTLYSLNGAAPIPYNRLPHMVRVNNLPKTGRGYWYPIWGAELGWAEVPDQPAPDAQWSTNDREWKTKPSHNPVTQRAPVWNGQAWSVGTKTLTERKADKVAEVTAQAQALIDAGFNYEIPSSGNTYTYSITDKMQGHMVAIQADLNNGGSGPQDGVWPDINDVDRTFTDVQWEAFASAARTYKGAILRNLRLFLRDVNSAANLTLLNQCDVSTGETYAAGDATGWPSNGS